MRPKTLVLLALALGCGTVAAIGINQVLSNRNPTIVRVDGDSESILVAMTEIHMGELITPDMVKLDKWPKDNLPVGALARLDQIEGRRAKVKVFAGDPLLEAKLLSKDANLAGASDFIPKGYRVVAVKVDDISAASNLIKPGDRVDVLVHLKANAGIGIGETKTLTVLQDIKVFSVNDVFHQSGDKPEHAIVARTVSMLVTPDQAELITHASEMGTIRLVMRSVEDDSVAQTDGATQSDLLGRAEHSERDKEEPVLDEKKGNELLGMLDKAKQPAQPATTAVQAQMPETWRMIVIEADKAQEVQFDKFDRLPTAVLPLGETGSPSAGPLPTAGSEQPDDPQAMSSGDGHDDAAAGGEEASGDDKDSAESDTKADEASGDSKSNSGGTS